MYRPSKISISIVSILVIIFQAINWNKLLLSDILVQRSLRRIQKVNFRSTAAYITIKRMLRSELDDHKEEFCDRRNIRFLVIGNDNEPNNDGKPPLYPTELCGATNEYIIQGGRPQDWSECLRSKLGDDARFDVFVLDYFEVADEYLVKLAGRIRSRFPGALIINLKHWYPFWVGYNARDLGGRWVDVSEWAEMNGYTTMSNDALHHFYYNTTLPWTTTMQYQIQQEYLAKATNKDGSNMTWTLYKGREGDNETKGILTQDMLIRRAWMYDDWNVRNDYGDEDVALGIFNILEERNMMRNDTVNSWFGNADNPKSCYI